MENNQKTIRRSNAVTLTAITLSAALAFTIPGCGDSTPKPTVAEKTPEMLEREAQDGATAPGSSTTTRPGYVPRYYPGYSGNSSVYHSSPGYSSGSHASESGSHPSVSSGSSGAHSSGIHSGGFGGSAHGSVGG